MKWFALDVTDSGAVMTDRNGDKLNISYDSRTKEVTVL